MEVKSKRDKYDRDDKKHKSKKRRHEEDGERSKRKKKHIEAAEDEDEWAEKQVAIPAEPTVKRDNWMLDPQSQAEAGSSFFSSMGIERTRRDKPKLKPDPDVQKISHKELNTTLLLSNQRSPSPPDANVPAVAPSHTPGGPGSQWRMTRLRRVLETAEEEGRPIEEVGVERFGSVEAFQAAQEERRILDDREGRRSGDSASRGRQEGEKRFMFNAESGSISSSRSSSFKRPSNVHHSSHPSTPTPPSNRRVDSLRLPMSASSAPSPLAQSHTPIPSVLTPPVKQPARSLSPSSLNRLQAKVIRAKLLGAPDAEALQKEYDDAACNSTGTQVEAMPTLDSRGRLYDIGSGKIDPGPEKPGQGNRRKKKEEKFQSHDPKTGEILRYNASDDRTTLADMLRHEKFGAGMNDQKNMDAELAKAIMSDGKYENNLDYIDDNSLKLGKEKLRSDALKRQFAIGDYKRTQSVMASCPFCFPSETSSSSASLPKAPIVALGTRTYLSCTLNEELVEGHCLIVPIQHQLNMLEGDDDMWDEVKNFMKTLMKMFSELESGQGVIFYETVLSFKKQKHTCIECVPVPWDVFDELPGYFKESIMTSETEWSTHKKLIDFSARPGGFRRSMVTNLPYFMVMFDHKGTNGYGHVIEGVDSNDREEEEVGGLGEGEKGSGEFPWYFAGEIVGNVLDIEPRKWRRPRKIEFTRNKERVQKFREKVGYAKYDWTGMIEKE